MIGRDRNDKRTTDRPKYQPLPQGQTVIIVTNKDQLIPKEPIVPIVPNGETAGQKTEQSATSIDQNQKPVQTLQAEKKNGECKILYGIGMLEAFLQIDPPMNDGEWPTLNQAQAVIAIEDLINVDESVLADAIDRHRTTPVLIAKGIPAVNGKDAELSIFYEVKDLHKIYLEHLVLNQNGRVDFHKVKTVQTVTKGEIIAEKTACTPGENGIDVKGRILLATPGVDKPIKLGKNVEWAEDNVKIIATEGGKPTLDKSNVLSVLPIHDIHEDVSFKTGDIIF